MAYKQKRIPCPDPGCKDGKITILHPAAKSGGAHDTEQKVTCQECNGQGTVPAPVRKR